MEDLNKLNALYFQSMTMSGLYNEIQAWQEANMKRLLSLSIQKDGDYFCCIALTNPSEVTIVGGVNEFGQSTGIANVFNGGLQVWTRPAQ